MQGNISINVWDYFTFKNYIFFFLHCTFFIKPETTKTLRT